MIISLVDNPQNKLTGQLHDVNVIGNFNIDINEFKNQKKNTITVDLFSNSNVIIGNVSTTIQWIFSKKLKLSEKISKASNAYNNNKDKYNNYKNQVSLFYKIFNELNYKKNEVSEISNFEEEEKIIKKKYFFEEFYDLNKINETYYSRFNLLIYISIINIITSILCCWVFNKSIDILCILLLYAFIAYGLFKKGYIIFLLSFILLTISKDFVEYFIVYTNDDFISLFMFGKLIYDIILIANIINIIIKITLFVLLITLINSRINILY